MTCHMLFSRWSSKNHCPPYMKSEFDFPEEFACDKPKSDLNLHLTFLSLFVMLPEVEYIPKIQH